MVESKIKKGSVSSKDIGKISPLKKVKSEQKSTDSSFEISLLNSLQIFLRYHGIERSHASIRDIADVSDGSYNYKDAVSSLENMEFSANVGKLSARKITEVHCPLVHQLNQ